MQIPTDSTGAYLLILKYLESHGHTIVPHQTSESREVKYQLKSKTEQIKDCISSPK